MAQQMTEYIIKALQLPRIGRKTAFKLFDNLNFRISSDEEFFDFVCENAEKFRLPEYSKSDLEQSLKYYDNIVYANDKNGVKSVSFYDESYPELYKDLVDKPIIINYIGDISKVNNLPSVAVIGTREPSESGAKAAIRFGEIFGEKGFNVVSGLAIGCDAGGHNGCLNKSGFTSAILAHGLDHIYPKENKSLAERILDGGGLLISEYFVGQKPLANYFVERDRLQAGLSNGIIVVETDIKGGTMHTVKFAKENKRRIAAFNHGRPELLHHPKTQGNQMLIREGTAFSLGTKEEIDNYLELLLNDHNARINPSSLTEELKELPKAKDGTQLNMFE
jgi:DNA processing protein